LAKQLLTETSLPMTGIAFASGFSSLRRFNDAFSSRYGIPPSRLRKVASDGQSSLIATETSTIQLSYRPPYDWEGMLTFLKARELKGIEWVTDDFYSRTVHLGNCKGWIKLTHEKIKNTLMLKFTHNLTPVLPVLLRRVRNLFDLNARPDVINQHLIRDKILGPLIKTNPGTRVPGAFNGFEMGIRAILGQQITVKAATTIASRLVKAFCEPIDTPFSELHYLTPSPEPFAKTSIEDIAQHGVVSARCKSIIALAGAHVSGRLSLDDGIHYDPEIVVKRLSELPGIGSWTAHYIAMRALRWTDAFPTGDIVILKRLGGVTAKEAEAISQAWRPWRSYATIHLWKSKV
jgi:AraC family transcriptional regulator of adaptative response / DNA-3-methyladenine glycosylase II